MTPTAAAYDTIRLMRRKVEIAEQAVFTAQNSAERDAAIAQQVKMTEQLVQSVKDFADSGYEDKVAVMLASAGTNPEG